MNPASMKSTVWWDTARRMLSGMLVGPGLAKNRRPRGFGGTDNGFTPILRPAFAQVYGAPWRFATCPGGGRAAVAMQFGRGIRPGAGSFNAGDGRLRVAAF